MREKLLALVLTVYSYLKAAADWTAWQLYLTLREIREAGFGEKLDTYLAVKAKEQGMDDRGQLGFQTIIAAVVVVIAVMLGVIIVDQMDSSLGTPSNSDLTNAKDNVTSGFADMASLVAPLLLVAIAVVIIGLLRRVS